MSALLESLANQSTITVARLSLSQIFLLLGNSITLGVILVASTYFASRVMGTMLIGKKDDDPSRQLLSAANQLFLCVGLTGTMLLMNENIIRAFAIIAALTLVRFRVRLDSGGISASLLFSVLIGMACGLGEVAIAWSVTLVYVALISLVLLTSLVIRKN